MVGNIDPVAALDKQRIAAICHFRNIHLYLVDVGDKYVSYMEYRCIIVYKRINDQSG